MPCYALTWAEQAAGDKHISTVRNRKIVESVLKELHELLGVKGDPHLALVYKHPKSMAQYHLGHLDLVGEIEAQANKLPGFALAGNAYRGIGIPDCINSGEQAASLLLEQGLK